MRWVGWVVVIVVLAAMALARLTDDKERRGRDPDTVPVPSGTSGSHAPDGRGADEAAVRVRATPESL